MVIEMLRIALIKLQKMFFILRIISDTVVPSLSYDNLKNVVFHSLPIGMKVVMAQLHYH